MVGPLRVTQALLPLLLKKDARKVINISSTLGSISTHRWAFASCLVDQSASIIAYETPWCLKSDSLTVNQQWGCPSWDTCSFCVCWPSISCRTLGAILQHPWVDRPAAAAVQSGCNMYHAA